MGLPAGPPTRNNRLWLFFLQLLIVHMDILTSTQREMMSSMSTPINFVARKRGETKNRSKNRDVERDVVMRKVFAEPGFAMRIAEHLGLTHQNISAWKRVPPHHVMKVAPLLELTPEEIRPDNFGDKRRRKP